LDLRAKLMSAPPANQTILLSAEAVISQLAFGAVKISFGELRHLAPGVFINSGGELDSKQIALPLPEILSRINPALLARRAARKVEVAEEIVGPFAERGRGFSFTTQPLKTTSAPPPPTAPEPSFASTPPAPRPVSPVPLSTPRPPPRSATPLAPSNGNGNGNGNGHPQSLAGSPSASRLTPPPTVAGARTNGNGLGVSSPPGLRIGSLNGNGRPATPSQPSAPMSPLKMAGAPAPVPPPLQPASSPAPAAIVVSLASLCESWPEAVKDEIAGSPLAEANVSLDSAFIQPGLKRGRVLMTWKQIRSLAKPDSAPSPKDSVELELPLKVIAPLFLAAQKNFARPQAKTVVSTDIPDLFFGFPQAAPAPVATPVTHLPPPPPADVSAVASAPPAAPVITPLPKPTPAKTDTNYYVWGDRGEAPQTDEAGLRRGEVPQTDFMSRQAHPKEVVARAAALAGVAGAVVAMQDGLRVASQVPAGLNPDTLAAFLPQIFDRLNQSTRELRMGALNNLNFTVGNVPWRIFRINAVYFAAFGNAGEPLPGAPLAQLAAELDRKKQQ
jgi:predicted regulator of Ras-like GTPase activity (Roadblock/LC7/MglB family)